jgi:hypothetical protein
MFGCFSFFSLLQPYSNGKTVTADSEDKKVRREKQEKEDMSPPE